MALNPTDIRGLGTIASASVVTLVKVPDSIFEQVWSFDKEPRPKPKSWYGPALVWKSILIVPDLR